VSINKSNYFHLVRVEQSINFWAFPLENKSFILVFFVLIHVYKCCLLIQIWCEWRSIVSWTRPLFSFIFGWESGLVHETRQSVCRKVWRQQPSKDTDDFYDTRLMLWMSILKKVVSRNTKKVHVLKDNCQIRKIMD